MKQIINIGVDLETASRQPNAAILSIAAQPFVLGNKTIDVSPHAPSFYEVINATSCVLAGMHFEQETIDWWSKQDDAAKAELLQCGAKTIRMALEEFVNYIEFFKKEYDAEVVIWTQGTDFDIAILKHAIPNILGVKELPWKYYNVRCARTFILEGINLLYPDCDCASPYDHVPELEGHTPHNALSDVKRMIHNVQWVHGQLQSKLNADD